MNIAIFGLGLIGGSLARDLTLRGHRVRGTDTDPASVAAALKEHVIAATVSLDGDGVTDADVVILAVPVQASQGLLQRLAPHLARTRLVMDTGSTKASVLAAAGDAGLGGRFIGAHPMAGDARSGWPASRPALFTGARVYLCRGQTAADDALRLAQGLWQELGAVPEIMEATAHDRDVAWTSHLPQLLATGLAGVLRDAGYSRKQLGPGGTDMTRLAGSEPRMWTEIACENAEDIVPALDALTAALGELRAAVEARHSEVLLARFGTARQWISGSPFPEP